MVKRIIALLFSALLMLPASALAENAKFTVGTEVFVQGTAKTAGGIAYDGESTLTLTNVSLTVTDAMYQNYNAACIIDEDHVLAEIKLVGENTMEVPYGRSRYAIIYHGGDGDEDGTLTISGSGSLSINSQNRTPALSIGGGLVIDGAEIDIECKGQAIWAYEDLLITNAAVLKAVCSDTACGVESESMVVVRDGSTLEVRLAQPQYDKGSGHITEALPVAAYEGLHVMDTSSFTGVGSYMGINVVTNKSEEADSASFDINLYNGEPSFSLVKDDDDSNNYKFTYSAEGGAPGSGVLVKTKVFGAEIEPEPEPEPDPEPDPDPKPLEPPAGADQNIPKTGDEAPLALLGAVLIVGLAGMLGLSRKRARNEK